MKKEIMEIIEGLNDSPETVYINQLKKESETKDNNTDEQITENYVLVKANKGSVTHLAKLTNLQSKYYIGCGSFRVDRQKDCILPPLEVKPENIGCKKCRAKLEQILLEGSK